MARAPPRRGPTTVVALQGTMAARPNDAATSQGTTAARLLKWRGLLHGSDGMGAGSDGGLGSVSDGPRSRLESFFIKN
jgi:hypothetical protein